MVVLKHLSREFNINPYKLRQLLRGWKLMPSNRRWKWEEGDKQLASIRARLKGVKK